MNKDIDISEIFFTAASGDPGGGGGGGGGNNANPKCKIWMFFGDKLVNGQLKIYKTDERNSFEIEDYDCSDLTKGLGIQFKGNKPNSFTLSETELLANSYDTWISYCVQGGADGVVSDSVKNTLGFKAFEAIYDAQDVEELIKESRKAFQTLADNASGVSTATIAGSTWKKFQGEDYADKWAKMKTVFDYIKSIYDTYYGRQFLVQVGDDNAGICIKDKFGNKPVDSVRVDGEGGIFYTSDVPTGDGGWPKRGTTKVLGLDIPKETEMFQTDDNRIGCFVKVGKIRGIQKQVKKNGQVYSWDIDFRSFSEDNFFIKRDNFVELDDANADFYCKGQVSGTIYAIKNEGQFAHFEIEPIRLKLGKDGLGCDAALTYPGAMALLTLFSGDGGNTVPVSDIKNMYCPPQGNGDTKTGTHLARDNINILSVANAAVFPEGVVIPFRSNLFVYGPWAFVANPIGGTQVEQNLSLVPWNFAGQDGQNGWDLMRTFGQLVAQDGPRGLQQQEEGSITAACLPNYNLGHMIGGNAAIISDMQISLGENGVQTTYNFQTYSPKFGQPGRHITDIWKNHYKRFLYLNKYFKEERLKVINIANQARKNTQATRGNGKPAVSVDPTVESSDKNSPVFLLMSAYLFKDYQENSDGGSLVDNDNGSDAPCDPCSIIATPAAGTATPSPSGAPNTQEGRVFSCIAERDQWEFAKPSGYKELAITSLDAIFTPVSLKGNEKNSIPRLAMYPNGSGTYIPGEGETGGGYSDFADADIKSEPGLPPPSRPRNEMPPFTFNEKTVYDLPIHQTYLNAYTSKKILEKWDDRKNASTKGFAIYAITYGTDYKKFNLGRKCDLVDDSLGGGTGEEIENKQLQEDFRFNSLKGPLMLQAWGYDTSGKPIPNEVDSAKEAEAGKFRKNGLKDKFMRDWLINTKTWPAGPIDLRFDRDRGVWVCPPSNKIVVARLIENLTPYSSATAELVNPSGGGVRFYEQYGIWGPDGENIKKSLKTAKIKVYDYLGVSLCSCDTVYAYYDDGKYIILESSRTYDQNPKCISCTTTTITTSTETIPTTGETTSLGTEATTESLGTETPTESIGTETATFSIGTETLTEPTKPPTPTLPTPNCWCDLDCLKTIHNFKPNKHQALVHTVITGGDCLAWEDIVECYPTPAPPERDLEPE